MQIATNKRLINQHEYLKKEDFYEYKSIGAGRTNKTCEYCGKSIPKGTPHYMAHFYPEFSAYPVHKECSDKFESSLIKE